MQALYTYLIAMLIPLMFTSGFSHVQKAKSALKELPYPSIQQIFPDTFSQASDFLMDSCFMETNTEILLVKPKLVLSLFSK